MMTTPSDTDAEGMGGSKKAERKNYVQCVQTFLCEYIFLLFSSANIRPVVLQV
jgi:hypothetical protein